MNLLFLNVGRRCELVELFRLALGARGGGIIHGSDVSPLAAGLQVVDCPVIFESVEGPAFEDELLRYCAERSIGLVIPTIDPDLVRLDRMHERMKKVLPGCHLLISPSATIRNARDKRLTKDVFGKAGILTATTLAPDSAELPFPIFVRPISGSAGVGSGVVRNSAELDVRSREFAATGTKFLVEEFIDGEEYTVDVLCDLDGHALVGVPRRRIKIRGGEVVQGVIDRNVEIEALARKAAEAFGARGPVTVQFLRSRDGKVYGTELNARMGGGLPLTVAAGADWCGWVLDLVAGRPFTTVADIVNGMVMTRADRSYFISPGQALKKL
jgi:carbamoyl-phosphate synthase large subunit